ncbi:MAG TPA: hypothetical protein VHO46_10725 [Bacteroidales bacterium]|nr:hypothetical protein [Bacteroidales bacterium]
MTKSIVILLFTVLNISPVFMQENKELQEKFLEAEYFRLNGDYEEALNLYLQVYDKLPENANIAHSIGVCYLNIQGRKNLAITYLEKAVSNMSAKRREGTINQVQASYDALYDLAKAYRINYKFDKAIETYRRYAGTLLPDDKENQDYINHEISVCEKAGEKIAHPVKFTEENMGALFNSESSDFDPVVSSDGKSIAWMVSMKFYDAVMFSRKIDGKWSAPINITSDLQSDGDFYISSLSADGKTLFLSRNDDFNSDIYISTFDGTTWSKVAMLNKNINTGYWESQASVSDDGTHLFFSSDRPGGFGGLDIYMSEKNNGEWGSPVNLGPEINTSFNEDRPFLVNKGKTLFFISQDHDNIGGYDLFRSERQGNSWAKTVNIGYPVNTPDDDYFFNPVSTGDGGYYSAFRDSGGFGKEDIYRITFQ